MFDQKLNDSWPQPGKGNVVRLIAGLAAGEPLGEIAEAMGVSVSTVYRRRRDPVIGQAVAEARADLNRQLLGRLAESQSRAHQVLSELLDHEDPAMRLRAANAATQRHVRLRLGHRERANAPGLVGWRR